MCGRTSARLNLPIQTINISAMKRRWQHLEGISLTSATQACKPRILIDQDNAHLTIARQGSINLFCASRRNVSGAIFLVAFSFILVEIVRQDSKV